MNKYLVALTLISSINLFARIPADIEKAIQESNLEEVQQLVPMISISYDEKIALLDLAEEIIVKRRFDIESKKHEYQLFKIKHPMFEDKNPWKGANGGLLTAIRIAVVIVFLPIIVALGPIILLALLANLPAIQKYKKLKQKIADYKLKYKNAVSIKQLIFAVETRN